MKRRRFAFGAIFVIAVSLAIVLLPLSKASKADKASVEIKPTEGQQYITATTGAAVLQAPTTSIQSVEADKTSGAGAAEAYEPNAAEVDALARMLYGEARGIASDMEKAACVWCVLNRVDDPRFPDTVLEVLEAPYQFAGYKEDYPLLPELQALAADVLTRYQAERDGNTEAGRVLPAEYVFFIGDGKNNHFTAEWKSEATYQWTLTNPYED